MQDKREQFKKEHPELSHKEIIAKLGEIWNALDQKEKEPYNAKAKIDKDKYQREKEEYNAKNKTVAPKKKAKEDEPPVEKKVKKVFFIVVQQISSYFFLCRIKQEETHRIR